MGQRAPIGGQPPSDPHSSSSTPQTPGANLQPCHRRKPQGRCALSFTDSPLTPPHCAFPCPHDHCSSGTADPDNL